MSRVQCFHLGVTLILLGLVLTFVEGNLWVQHGGLPYGLLTLLGMIGLAYGMRLLRPGRMSGHD